MFKSLLSLFLKDSCPLCGRPATHVICTDCDRQIQRTQWPNPKWHWQGELPLFVWGRYAGILKQAIAAIKYENHPELAAWLGMQLALAWRQHFPEQPKVTLVPIPMHPQKQAERGYNQAELIARQFAKVTGDRIEAKALQRTKATQPLFSLSRQARQQELQQAFSLDRKACTKLKGQSPILLIDDIYTTGATALEVQQVFSRARLKTFGIAAIATSKQSNAQQS